jgi:SPP1 family predicted phage head-tail adaptor
MPLDGGLVMGCCDFSAGGLRQTITFEEKTQIPDGCGGITDGWQKVLTARAQIKPVSGSERYQSMRLEATVTHQLIVRYNPFIKPWHRIRFGDRYFNIRSILNVEERNRWMIIKAEEGVAQ